MDTLIPFPRPTAADDSATIHKMIARRAQEIWRDLGCPANRDLDIWLEAEAEIEATRNRSYRHPHSPLAK